MAIKVSLVHIGCVALILLCAVVSFTILKGQTEAQVLVMSCACGLYGKLGFKPAKSVQEALVLAMPPAEVERIQSMKPPAQTVAQRPPPPAAPVVQLVNNESEPPRDN